MNQIETMNTPNVTVVYADDHNAVREGLVAILNQQPNIRVIAEAANGEHLLNRLRYLDPLPDIAILDIDMPIMDGYATAREIRKKYSGIKMIAMSYHKNEFNIIKMINCGIVGYLIKDTTSLQDIFKAIRDVHSKGYYYSDLVNEEIFEKAKQTDIREFTERELCFLSFCCQGLSNKEIAEKMFVSPRTVEYYYTCICNKVKMTSRIALVAFALKTGIIHLNS